MSETDDTYYIENITRDQMYFKKNWDNSEDPCKPIRLHLFWKLIEV